MRKNWILGFLGFLFLLGIPGILTQDWLDMVWLVWIVWFIYFIPKKKKGNKKPGIGVGIMILKDNKVLLGKRHGDPEKADSELHGESSWTMPGGKLHFKETLKDTACREVLEEAGININKENLKLISISDDMVEDAHFVTIGFLYEGQVEEPKVTEPDEIIEWRWFELDNLPSPIFFPSKKVLENYIAKKIY